MGYRPDGLQQERTALAWRRSALGFVLVSVLIMRAGVVAEQPVIVALSLAVVPVALLVFWLTYRTRPWRRASAAPPRDLAVLTDGRLPALITGVAIALCGLVAVLAFVS